MKNLLAADAKNRSVRTILQGAAYVILLAVGLVVYNAFDSANGWGDFDWTQLAFSAVQAAVMAGFAYLMRAKLDSSSVPTPLPPENPGQPAEDVPGLAGGVIPNVPEQPAAFEYQPQRGMNEDGTPMDDGLPPR